MDTLDGKLREQKADIKRLNRGLDGQDIQKNQIEALRKMVNFLLRIFRGASDNFEFFVFLPDFDVVMSKLRFFETFCQKTSIMY